MLTINKGSETALKTQQTKLPIGQLLKEAGLISGIQLDLVLQNQTICGYEEFKLGEILNLRGWVKQETTDFFASRWESVVTSAQTGSFKQKIGDYLYDAHLLTSNQIAEILQYQKENRMLFGTVAVSKGYVKQETIDFFIKHLFAVSRNPSKVEQHLKRAQGYIYKKDDQGAVLELREALKLEPNNHKCHAWIAQTYLLQNQMSLAKIHIKKAMQVNPNDSLVKEVSAKISSVTDTCSSKSTAIANNNNNQKNVFKWLNIS